LRNNEGVTWFQLDDLVTALFLQQDLDLPGDEKKKLISVGMHLASVRVVPGQKAGTDRQAVDSWRGAQTALQELGPASSLKPDGGSGKVERLSSGSGHLGSSP
jgi:hypothetical protein